MNNPTITHYLQKNSKTLSVFLSRLEQIKQWNQWLQESLGLEKEDKLAQHCHLVNIAGTSLIAIADNSHWVTRFRFYIPELLPKLRRHPDLALIKAICCKVQPNYVPVAAPARRGPQKTLSRRNAELLRETASQLTNEKLKAILEKIAGY